jgi:hypothetical protein
MTDNDGGVRADAPMHRITNNIRGEIVRRGLTLQQAREAIDMPPSTWDARMRNPNLWRLGELASLADLLHTTPGSLVD